MKKIINASSAALISKKSKKLHKKIVLVGGCFDILHSGHIYFLLKSKGLGDILIVLLESDENIKKRKGDSRPINPQKNRGIVLSAIPSVDFIIPLSGVTKNEDYDKLMIQISPEIVAITRGDKNLDKRQLQTNAVGAKLVEINKIEGISTSKFIKDIN